MSPWALFLLPPLAFASPKSPSPSLFFFDPSGGSCAWRVYDAAAREARTIAQTPSCPEHVAFDPKNRRTWFELGGRVYISEWNRKTGPTERARLPFKADALWLSKESGRLRAAQLVRIDEETGVVRRGTHVFFRFEGDVRDASGLPDWGTPQMAVAAELQSDGSWTRVAAVPTKAEAGDTPGLGALGEALASAEGTATLEGLLQQGTCAAQDCGLSGLKTPAQKLAAILGIPPGEPADLGDHPAFAPLGKGTGLLFKVAFGDSAHAVGPVFYCRSNCASAVALAGLRDGQLEVWRQGDFALVAGEYDGAGASVFGPSGPTPLLTVPQSRGAVWLPFPGSSF